MSVRLPAAERRAQLLDQALVIFGERGFHEASMQDIATSAGVTKPVLYQHFASKEDLFEAVVTEAASLLRNLTEEVLGSTTSAHDQVARGIGAIIDTFAHNPAMFRVIYGESGRTEPRVRALVDDVQNQLAAGVAGHLHGVGRDDPALQMLLAHAITGMAESALRYWFESDSTLDLTDIKTQLVELAWAGLRGVRPA